MPFIISNGHLEYRVLHGLGTRPPFQSALQFGTFNLVNAKSGTSGSALTYISRIDVPTWLSGSCKDDIYGGRVHTLILHGETYLRLHCHHDSNK